jgi:hypothetical protein
LSLGNMIAPFESWIVPTIYKHIFDVLS